MNRSFNIDDPLITAYALGELDESERLALEAAVSESPELQSAVAHIRAMADRLTAEFAAEPVAAPAAVGLSGLTLVSADRRLEPTVGDADSLHALQTFAPSHASSRRIPMIYSLVRSKAIAASLLLLITTGAVVTWSLSQSQSRRHLASGEGKPRYYMDPIHLNSPDKGGTEKLGKEVTEAEVPEDLRSQLRSIGYIGWDDSESGSEAKDVDDGVVDVESSGVHSEGAVIALGDQTNDLHITDSAVAVEKASDLIQQLTPYTETIDSLGYTEPAASRNRDSEGRKFAVMRGNSPRESDLGVAFPGYAPESVGSVQEFENPRNQGEVGEAYLLYGEDGRRFGGKVGYTDAKQIADAVRSIGYVGEDESDEGWVSYSFPVEGRPELVFGVPESVSYGYQVPDNVQGGFGCYADALLDNGLGAESYDTIIESSFLSVVAEPLSTISIDVDTASYANIRRMINAGQRPPKGAVRIEELVNYFTYDYAPPAGDEPFAFHLESADCPWQPDHRLVRVGIKGFEVPTGEHPLGNFVFLIDTSGSMQEPHKLPLVQESLKLLVENLPDDDRVAIAVYAGSAGLVLDSTPLGNRGAIMSAIDSLSAGGSTNGGEGIQLAYDVAADNFIKDGANRVILCTDGDFNVGVTDRGELVDLITMRAKEGVFLSVMGFGMGNLKDDTMEKLADMGNGNYGYIDTLDEARKLFVEQLTGTLVTIAKDVKIQIEFNPAQAQAYRLIGYENRKLANQDFNDDTKDAGEIGAGHTVTALYEVVPVGVEFDLPTVDPLKYQPTGDVGESVERASVLAQEEEERVERPAPPVEGYNSDELLTLKFRYKAPDEDTSLLVEVPFTDSGSSWSESSSDFQFASAVAAFGMVLRDSQYCGGATLSEVASWTDEAMSNSDVDDPYRDEFRELIDKAGELVAASSAP